MAKKKQQNVLGMVVAMLTVLGVVLAIVGLCAALVSTKKLSIGLWDDIWDTMGKTQSLFNKVNVDVDAPSRTFTIVAYIITLVGMVVVAADIAIKLVRGKGIKYVGLIAGAITVIGGALILISGIVLKNRFNDYVPGDAFSMDLGIYLGFVGGLIAGAAGLVSALVGSKK